MKKSSEAGSCFQLKLLIYLSFEFSISFQTYFLDQDKMATGNVLSRGVFVVAAKRTPFGTFGGSLKAHSPVDLQVLASNAAMASIGLKPEQVNSVCIGNVLNASSPDAPYLARHVALRCGMPVPTPAYIGNDS